MKILGKYNWVRQQIDIISGQYYMKINTVFIEVKYITNCSSTTKISEEGNVFCHIKYVIIFSI